MRFQGHFTVVVTSVLFTLTFVVFQGGSLLGQIFYRTLFLAATIAYGVSLYQRFGGVHPSFYVLLRMESFQYGALAALWLVSRYHWIKIVPFFAYSALQASDYIATEAQPGSALSQKIIDFRTNHIVEVSRYIAYANLAIYARIILEVITIRPGSTMTTLAYSLFFRIRLAYSPSQHESIEEIKQMIDSKMQHPKVPAKVKEVWDKATKNADSYEHFELDPKKAKEKAELRRKTQLEDNEAAKKARDTFASEKANGSVAE